MNMLAEAITCRFENFSLDYRVRGLFRLDNAGRPRLVSLGARALDILCVLVERDGALVSKQEIMDAVWPGVAVEENNLTVQMSALRRVLDEGRAEGSCIQTIPGRGYRFLPRVIRSVDPAPVGADIHPFVGGTENAVFDPPPAEPARPAAPDPAVPARRSRRAAGLAVVMGVLAVVAVTGAFAWHLIRSSTAGAAPPPLSIVVLPFENLSGNPAEDYLADGITDDLTSDLAHFPGTFVIARESAYRYKGKAADVRQIGRELGVRYVLEGSVRRAGDALRVNAQLTSAETGAHLWSDRFDEQITELTAAQEQAVTRMHDELGINMVEIENARSLRERPTNPNASDLILRARSLRNQPETMQRDRDILALFERALTLDPSSVYAMTNVAYYLIETAPLGIEWGSFPDMQRAGELLGRAREIAPDSELVLNTTVLWLRTVGRCQEAVEAAERAIKIDPQRTRIMTGIYNELATCRTRMGQAEEGIALQERANQLNPRSPWRFVRYRNLGWYSLLLGRDKDAVMYLERSLAIKPEADPGTHQHYRMLAAAYARTGEMVKAKQALMEADRLWPYDTVRGHWPDDSTSTVYAAQIRRFQDGLRLAGERDHADENADFGVPADGVLHSEFSGRTPMGAPGAQTIRTPDLLRFVAGARPIVIDAMTYSWGRSIPGAVGLKFAGLGGSLTDAAQDRLRRKMHELTAGDRARPIVAVGWNSERFDGRNLALRLLALGYTKVYWYRGGREAWEVAGLPETDLTVTDW